MFQVFSIYCHEQIYWILVQPTSVFTLPFWVGGAIKFQQFVPFAHWIWNYWNLSPRLWRLIKSICHHNHLVPAPFSSCFECSGLILAALQVFSITWLQWHSFEQLLLRELLHSHQVQLDLFRYPWTLPSAHSTSPINLWHPRHNQKCSCDLVWMEDSIISFVFTKNCNFYLQWAKCWVFNTSTDQSRVAISYRKFQALVDDSSSQKLDPWIYL